MTPRELRNRQFLTELFSGSAGTHAIVMDHEKEPASWPGDVAISERPVRDWVPWAIQNFEAMLAFHESLDDDSVPYIQNYTGTEIFAAAFGCDVHLYEKDPPCALPIATSAEEADRIDAPGLDARPLARVFEFCHLLRDRLGPEVPIGVPDIQSPFDIAAMIWRKEDLFVAMHEQRDAVKRLVAKCQALLVDFLNQFKRQFPECNLCHCPNAWAPTELGCWLSEDEAGSMSVEMFEEFCLPSLVELTEGFGGLFVHCCATADHQYGSFKKIPNLRGLNRVFQEPGAGPAIKAFSGNTVLIVAWYPEENVHDMLRMAQPDTRFLFNMPAQPLDESKGTLERLRTACCKGGA